MGKNIKNSGSGSSKNIRNDDSLKLSVLKVTDATITNATITNLTNTELQTATSDISTLQSTVSTNITNIATNSSDITDLQNNKQDIITAGDGLSFTGSTLNAEVTQAELDLKQDIITAGDGLSFTGTTLNAEVSQAELDLKQDIITDSTDIELNQLEVNDKIKFQFGTNDEKTLIERGDANGKLKFTANNVFFHDDTDTLVFNIKNNGDLNCNNNSIDNVADIDFNGSSLITQLSAKQETITAGDGLSFTGATLNAEVTQSELDTKQDIITAGDGLSFTGTTLNAEVTQFELDQKQDVLTAGNGIDIVAGLGTTISVDEAELTTKQDTLTSSTAISVASVNLNNGNLTNGGTGNFSSINLSGSDLQGKIDDKADLFGILLPLELDSLAIPNPALKLNYNTTHFQLNGTDLELTGSLPTLTSSLNCGTNSVTGITSLSVRSIELHNSTSGQSFLDFGGGDFRFRQLYNQTANTFTMSIDDATGENPEEKMQITRTEVNILNADLNMNDQDLIGTKYIQGDSSIKFYVDGDTTGGTDFTLDLKTDGDADFNGGSLLNVEELQNSVKINEWGGSPNSATNNLWGNDNIHDVFIEGININSTGMISHSLGVFTINEAGTYTITCDSAIENVDYNNRLVAAQYLSVNNDTTRFRTTPGSFAFSYIRDDNFGVSNSLTFSTTLTLSQNDTIRFKTRLAKATDNRAYDDTHSETGLNWWCGVRFQKHLIA